MYSYQLIPFYRCSYCVSILRKVRNLPSDSKFYYITYVLSRKIAIILRVYGSNKIDKKNISFVDIYIPETVPVLFG